MHQLRAVPNTILNLNSHSGRLDPIGSPSIYPIRQLILTNISSGPAFFSDDGENVKWVVLGNTTLTVDFTANSHLPEGDLVLPAGIQFYVSTFYSIASIYISCIHAKGD